MEKTSKKSLSTIISDGDEKQETTTKDKLKVASPYFALAALEGGLSGYALSGEMMGSDYFIRLGLRTLVLPSYVKTINFSTISWPLNLGFGIAGLAATGFFVAVGLYKMHSLNKKNKESDSSYKTE